MGNTIDTLDIRISAGAKTAKKSIDSLISSLGKLNSSLTKVNGSSIGNLGTRTETKSINNLSNGMLSLSASSARTKTSINSLAVAFGKFYANCFLLIRAFKALKSAINSSMDYTETYNYFNVTMDKISKEWSKDYKTWGYENAESYADSFQGRLKELNAKMTGYSMGESGELTYTGEKNLGLDTEQIINYQASIGAITNSLGTMGETTINTQKALSMLSADLSSLKNVELSTVMTNMQSGLIGQSRALYKYGIDITNATLQTYAYDLGLSKSVSEMTQAEKMQLRLIAILDQSKVAWGDQANTINSVANQYRMFKQQISNAARVIGNLFLPIVQKALPVINGLVIAMNQLLETLGFSIHGDDWLKNLQDGTSEGSSAFDDLTDEVEDTADALDDASENANKLKKNTLGIDKLNIIGKDENADTNSAGTGSASSGAIDLSKEIASAVDNYESVWEKAFKGSENLAQKYAKKIIKAFKTGDWESVGKYFGEKLNNALSSIPWEEVYSKAKGFGKGLANFLNGLITPETFGNLGKTIAGAISTKIQAALSFGLTFDWENLGLSIASGINGFFKEFDFGDLAETINVWVQGIWNTIKTAFLNINWKSLGKGFIDFFGQLDASTIILIPITGKILSLAGAFGKLAKTNGLLSALGTALYKLTDKVVGIAVGFGRFIKELTSFKGIGQKASWTTARIGEKFDNLSKRLSTTQKLLLGVGAGFVEFKGVSKVVGNIYDGTQDLGTSILKLTGYVAAAGIAFKVAFGVSSPVAIGISAIIGLMGALTTIVEKEEEAERKAFENKIENLTKLDESQQKVYDNIKKTKEEYEEVSEAADKQAESIEKQYEPLELYKEQLDEIVDSNGNIKSGYEDQAQAIIDQLNPALGLNAEIVDGQIQGYKELSENIDETIARKKAEAMLEAYQDEWVEATKNVQQAYENVTAQFETYQQAQEKVKDIDKQIVEQTKKVEEAYKNVEKVKKTGSQNDIDNALKQRRQTEKQLENLEKTKEELVKNVETQKKAYDDAAKSYGEMQATIDNHGNLLVASVSGDTEECDKAISNMVNNVGSTMHAGAVQAKVEGEHLGNAYTDSAIDALDERNDDLRTKTVDTIKNIFGDNKISKTFQKHWEEVFEDVEDGVEDGKLGKAIESMWEKIFGKEITFTPQVLKNDSNLLQDLDKNKFSFKIKTYATGGLPEDGWFRVSKGEYLGQFDDGTSYIANNKQVENGVAKGVEEAAYRGMLRALSQGNSQSKDQTIIVQSVLDGKVIAQSTNRYNARSGAKMLSYGTGYN